MAIDKKSSNFPGVHHTRFNYLNKIIRDAGWSSLVARRAHNPKVVGSNPTPATNKKPSMSFDIEGFFVSDKFYEFNKEKNAIINDNKIR